MNFNDIRTIRSEEEYQAALKTIRPYFETEPEDGTPEAEHFDALMLLIEHYEEKHYRMDRASPIEVIRSVMEANGYKRADLVAVIGSKARASELLSGKRELSLEQIRKLSRAWHIPVRSLINA